jgi:PAS domain S-box-containing protein
MTTTANPRTSFGQFRPYLIAVVAVAMAAAIRLAIDPVLGNRFPYAIFLIAVLVAGFAGKLWCGLLALGLSALVANYLFVEPRYSVAPGTVGDMLMLILFLFAGGLGSLIADYVTRTRERLQVAAEEEAARDAEVRAERARLQDIIDSIPGVVWEAWGRPDSSEQRIDYVSNYVEKLVGYSSAEWLSEPNFWLKLVHPDDRDQAARVAADMFANGEAGENEFRWIAKDGRTIWVLARSTVIRDEDHKPIGMRGVTIDITDRKEAAQRLALLADVSTTHLVPSFEDLARDIAQRIAIVVGDYCIIRIAHDGHLEGIAYAHVSPEGEPLVREIAQHFDVSTQSALYAEMLREPRTVVDNAVPETVFAHLKRGPVGPLFERFRPRRGMICPLLSQGKLLGTIALGRSSGGPFSEADVRLVEAIASRATSALENASLFATAQREADEARIARAEAEEAGRVKDEFLATLSHELRTPLNAILGWAHMLRDPVLPVERRAAAIETIVRNAQSQEQLISDILDVQRIMAGKIRLNQRVVDLGAIVRSAAETVQPSAAAKNVRLQLLVDLDTPSVWGDPDRLQQIVWNLLSNAIKFAPSNGRVLVRLLKDESDCELVVQDNGPGIHEAFIPHMFERFRQADSSTTRTHKGLGLGLAIVRSLVEMHGGTITAANIAESHETGAIFTIRLPIHVAAKLGDMEEEMIPTQPHREPIWLSDAPALEGIHVLVVEDDPDARELIGAILHRCGAKVTLTASAEAGFGAATSHRPDVIVSDIEMPEEDGYGLIRRIRALPPDEGGAVPVAALTAYAGASDRLKVLGAGFNVHVAKPVQPAELAMVVASLAGRRS